MSQSSVQNMWKLWTELNPQLNTQSKPGTSHIYEVLIDKEVTEKKNNLEIRHKQERAHEIFLKKVSVIF